MAPLMIIGTVPLYNICAVAALTLTSPALSSAKSDPASETSASKSTLVSNSDRLFRTVKGIITNPIILGIAAGFAWSLLKYGDRTAGFYSRRVRDYSVLSHPSAE